MRKLPVAFRCLIFALMPGLWSGILSAAYIRPDTSKELFRLEKIPLQVDQMIELSKHLVILAKRQHQGEAVQDRSTAQMLALALMLDPTNQEARDVNQDLAKRNKLELANDIRIGKANARIRFFKRWLSHPDAGSDANKLAAYIEDATKVLNPDTLGNADMGDWKSVISPLEKYSQGSPVRPKEREVARKAPERIPESDPFKSPSNQISKFHIANLSVKAPYSLDKPYTYIDRNDDGREKTGYKPVDANTKVYIELSPWNEGDGEHLKIEHISRNRNFDEHGSDPISRGTAAVLYELLITRHKNLGQYKSKVTIAEGHYARSNNLALTAALALMLESSATNKPLRDDLHVCGSIDGKGKFLMQDNFWSSLKILRQSKTGGRLIVPKEASNLVTQILVYEEPDFFTRWQVFAVDNLDEAMAVSIKGITGELAVADQLFESIQQLALKKSVPLIAANKAVRSRLIEISKKSPTHLSSRTLLLQGTTKRPRYFSAEALAHNLLPAVTRMHSTLARTNPDYPSPKKMTSAHEDARAMLDPLVNMVDRSNAQLYKSSVDLANDFRSLSLLIRRMRDRDDYGDLPSKKIRTDYVRMATKAKELLDSCRKTAGLPDIEN